MELYEYSFTVEKSHMNLLRNGRKSALDSSSQNPNKYRPEVTVLMDKMSPSWQGKG
jgi:hypothetical protein